MSNYTQGPDISGAPTRDNVSLCVHAPFYILVHTHPLSCFLVVFMCHAPLCVQTFCFSCFCTLMSVAVKHLLLKIILFTFEASFVILSKGSKARCILNECTEVQNPRYKDVTLNAYTSA